MTREELARLLEKLVNGKVSAERVIDQVASNVSVQPLGFATIDHHREIRQGFPEVILCEGKTPTQVAFIARRIVAHKSILLATRADRGHFMALRRSVRAAKFDPVSRTITANTRLIRKRGRGTILVVTAGTSDIPVAEEAAITATVMGNEVDRLFDVGVAGIHRILRQTKNCGMLR